jgi:hypothetical protein
MVLYTITVKIVGGFKSSPKFPKWEKKLNNLSKPSLPPTHDKQDHFCSFS